MSDIEAARNTLNQMIGGYWSTQALYVAAELGIADLLASGPRGIDDLALQTKTHPEALYRVLRALASVGVFTEEAERQFALTPLAERLRSDAPESQRFFAIMSGAEMYHSWAGLLSSVQSGTQAFEKAFGRPVFQYLTERPERGQVFDAAMTGVHSAETAAMLDAYDFSPFDSVVDIGGGNGLMLADLLERYPAIQGMLFDLPAVVERARPVVAGRGLSERCRIVGGDVFVSVPADQDVYLMRHVIHDWDDTDAVKILRNTRDAMAPDSRLLVVESVIPPGNEPCFGKWLDLMMLVVGGRERTREQYERLFAQAGLTLTRVIPTAHEISLIEGTRAI